VALDAALDAGVHDQGQCQNMQQHEAHGTGVLTKPGSHSKAIKATSVTMSHTNELCGASVES
jgi:hypothetical protein